MNFGTEKYRANYKQNPKTTTNTLQTRKNIIEKARKNARYEMLNLQRNIEDEAVKTKVLEVKATKVISTKVQANCTKNKPVFKVCRVHPEELYSLENAFKYIKGRPIKQSFAPKNHEFKPPKNIKTIINLPNKLAAATHKQKSKELTATEPIKQHNYNLRNRNKAIDQKVDKKHAVPSKNVKLIDKTPNVTIRKKTRASKQKDSETIQNIEALENDLNTTFILDDSPEDNQGSENPHIPAISQKKERSVHFSKATLINESEHTPDNRYIIDLQQCKDTSAKIKYRKTPLGQIIKNTNNDIQLENGKDEKEKAMPDSEEKLLEESKPEDKKESVEFFSNQLNTEITRITKMCNNWTEQLNMQDLPEHAHTSIAATIGQSKLLISSKFQQFRKLIDEYHSIENQVNPISCEDLHGFWDMMYIQVEDINGRFEILEKLKNNNWIDETERHTKQQMMKRKQEGKSKKVTNNKPNSKLRNFINAARKQQEQQNENNIEPQTPTRLSKRWSGALKLNTPGSPGLTTLKIACSIKQRIPLTPININHNDDVIEIGKWMDKTHIDEHNKENILASPLKTPRRSTRLMQKLKATI